MLHEEYTCLITLLERLEASERRVIERNKKGPMYWAFVEKEMFDPIARVKELAEVRAKQTEAEVLNPEDLK